MTCQISSVFRPDSESVLKSGILYIHLGEKRLFVLKKCQKSDHVPFLDIK